MKRFFALFLVLTLISVQCQAATQSIWGSTSRGSGVSTYRLPVDISSNSGPGYLELDNAPCGFNVGNGLTNAGCALNTTQPADRTISGTTDTITNADASKFVVSTGASPVTATIAGANTAGYGTGFAFAVQVGAQGSCASAGAYTLTPSTGLINGASSFTVQPCTTAYFRSNTTDYLLDFASSALTSSTKTTFTKQQNFGTAVLTDAATINWNLDTQQAAKVTIAASRTMAAPTNMVDGGNYTLRVIQGGAGSFTMTWNAVFKWPSGIAPVLSTVAGAIDLISCQSNGTSMLCVATLDIR